MDWNPYLELSLAVTSSVIALATRFWAKRQRNRRWALVAPALWILCLGLSSVLAEPLIGDHLILISLTYVAIAWGGIRVAFILAPNRKTAWISILTICGLILLTLLELRTPLADYLDSFTLTIYGVRFSLMKLLEMTFLLTLLVWTTRSVHHWMAMQLRNMQDIDPTVREWLVKLTELALYCLALIGILAVCGIDVTTLTVFGGALGVSIGLGLQKLMSNYVSGLILLFEKTVKVGDVIELDGGPFGRISRLDPRGTFILGDDGREIIVPNDEFITKKVTNWTYSNTKGRISIPVSVVYGTDIERAQSLLVDAAREHPQCITDPPPTCLVREFGPYGIDVILLFWVNDVSPGLSKPQSEVMVAILSKLQSANIEMPTIPHVFRYGGELREVLLTCPPNN